MTLLLFQKLILSFYFLFSRCITPHNNFLHPQKIFKTYLKNKPGVRIKFEYEVFNEENTLLTKAETMLVFVDMKTGKPTNAPQYFDQLIDENFKEEV